MNPSIQSGLSVEVYTDYSKLVVVASRIEARNDNKRKIYDKNNPKCGSDSGRRGQNQYSRKKRVRDKPATGGCLLEDFIFWHVLFIALE